MQFLMNGLATGSAVALVAVGFSLVYAVERFFNFAYGAAFIGGGYAAYLVVTKVHGAPFACLPVAALAGAIIGLGTEGLLLLPLARRGASSTVLLLSSLGLLIIVENVVSLVFGDGPAIFQANAGPGLVFLSAKLTRVQVATACISAAVPFVLVLWLRLTRIGLQIRAWMQNPDLAIARGIHARMVPLAAVAAASAIAGLAAALAGLDTNLTPLSGFRALLTGSVAAMIGGVGSPFGAYMGGLFVGMAQTFVVIWLPSAWQDSVVFFILLVWLIMSRLLPYRIRSVD